MEPNSSERRKALYYPYGKNGACIEVVAEKLSARKFVVRPTTAGRKDAKFIGYVFDSDGDIATKQELNFL